MLGRAVIVVVATVTVAIAQPPTRPCKAGTYKLHGIVQRAKAYSREFDGFVFKLEPMEYGWRIDISRGEQHYLESMTGPRHAVPNPVEIEGWHFRNSANTGPNRGDVDAPQYTRRFLFSPRWRHCPEAPDIGKDGKGVLEITDLELGNLRPGAKANISRMKFRVTLTVGSTACEQCPAMQTEPKLR